MNDILIIGAGPSALQLAARSASLGMSVRCVAPSPEEAWLPRFGAWSDELASSGNVDSLGLTSDCIDTQWEQTVAFSPDRIALGRGYTRLSTSGLQRHLLQQASRSGVTLESGVVSAIEHRATYSDIILQSGAVHTARVVVDASGHGGGFVQRTPGTACAWQYAYGTLLRVPGGHPWPLNEMVLMDFRLPAGAGPEWRHTPTFLYAMPLDQEHVFVEETSLVHRAPPSMAALSQRLQHRLASMGIPMGSGSHPVGTAEHCRIRMYGPPAVIGQRTFAYGAAADMVQPATGYQLMRALHTAGPVAAALSRGLSGRGLSGRGLSGRGLSGRGLSGRGLSGGGPAVAAREAWATLWPADRQRAWALYRFGSGILADLNHQDIVDFFSTFFDLPAHLWQGFHSANQSPRDIARTMAVFFLNAPSHIRRLLLAAGASRPGASLLHAVVRI